VTDRCEVRGCRGAVALIYLGHGICDDCWNRFTAEDVPRAELRMALGLDDAEAPATEEAMTEAKKSEAKTSETKTTKKPRVKKATAATKEPKAPKPKREKQPLVVFAFRLTQAERDAIHKAAGPRNATQFVRRVAVAFAEGDESAFRAVVKDAAAHQ